MPADTNFFGIKFDRKQSAMFGHDVMGQGGFTIAKTSIGFLERNDIGTDLVNHGQYPLRSTQSVRTNGLADIIAGNPDHRATLAASSASAKPKCGKAVLVELQAHGDERPAPGVPAVLEIAIMEAHDIVAY